MRFMPRDEKCAALRRNRSGVAVAVLAAALSLGLPSASLAAAGTPATFAGSCQFAGPISPGRPITVLPVPGAHFSYRGLGTCSGTLDQTAVAAAPITVTFTNASTLFDTCELGPDFGLHGVGTISSGRALDRFDITVDLARLAVVGPFVLRTAQAGLAAGIAQFVPADLQASLSQCAGPGLDSASLSANFATLSPLVGSSQTVRRRPLR